MAIRMEGPKTVGACLLLAGIAALLIGDGVLRNSKSAMSEVSASAGENDIVLMLQIKKEVELGVAKREAVSRTSAAHAIAASATTNPEAATKSSAPAPGAELRVTTALEHVHHQLTCPLDRYHDATSAFAIRHRLELLGVYFTIINVLWHWTMHRIKAHPFAKHYERARLEQATALLMKLWVCPLLLQGYSLLVYNLFTGCTKVGFFMYLCACWSGTIDGWEWVYRWPMDTYSFFHHLGAIVLTIAIAEEHDNFTGVDESWELTLLFSNIGLQWISDALICVLFFSSSVSAIKKARRVLLSSAIVRIVSVAMLFCLLVKNAQRQAWFVVVITAPLGFGYCLGNFNMIRWCWLFDPDAYFEKHQILWLNEGLSGPETQKERVVESDKGRCRFVNPSSDEPEFGMDMPGDAMTTPFGGSNVKRSWCVSIGEWLIALNVMLAVLSALVGALLQPWKPGVPLTQRGAWLVLEIYFTCFFTVLFLLRIMANMAIWRTQCICHLLSGLTLIEVLTLIPFYAELIFLLCWPYLADNFEQYRILVFVRLLRVCVFARCVAMPLGGTMGRVMIRIAPICIILLIVWFIYVSYSVL